MNAGRANNFDPRALRGRVKPSSPGCNSVGSVSQQRLSTKPTHGHAGLVLSSLVRRMVSRLVRLGVSGGVCAILLALMSTPVAAQSTQPVGASATDAKPIRRDVEQRIGSTAQSAAPAQGIDLTRVLAALGIVIALILLLWWVGKRYFNPGANIARGRAVRVLSRQPIAPRQQVMLLQVGSNRVIVVADSGGTLTTLANIDDPDEVAHLVGTTRAATTVRPTGDEKELEDARPEEFESALGAQQLRFDTADTTDPQTSAARSEVSSLLDKVKSLRAQLTK
jgi:flagellar biogenesis protein FliO